jgi:YD repeat-containing protein
LRGATNLATHVTRKGDTIAYAYDTLNRLCTKTYATSAVACGGTSSNYLATYAYDLDGRLTAANDNSSSVVGAAPPTGLNNVVYTTSYVYDVLNRPTGGTWDNAPTQTATGGSFTHQYDKSNFVPSGLLETDLGRSLVMLRSRG